MTTALFTDLNHDIMTIIRKIRYQHQRADINSIHKKIIKIPDYQNSNIEIPIYDDSYSISHVETPSAEYNLQTPNNSLIASAIPETHKLKTNMINGFSFTKVTLPEDELLVYSVSEQSPTILENKTS